MNKSILLLILLTIISCNNNEKEDEYLNEGGILIGLSDDTFSLGKESSIEIVKTENSNWYIAYVISYIGESEGEKYNNDASKDKEVVGDWFAIKKIDLHTLEIKVEKNDTEFVRKLEITLSSGSSFESIHVKQNNKK